MGKFRDIWDTDRDGKNAEKRSFFRYAIVATALFIILVGFVNQNNFLRWIKAGAEIRRQDKMIEKYRDEIKEMDAQIHGLTNNKDSLEQYARENFLFAEPGDDVYVVEDPS
jgi:cell division protein FtsB